MTIPNGKRWYAIRTYSGHENKVKAHLENEIKMASLEERISAVLVPSEKIIEMKLGEKERQMLEISAKAVREVVELLPY